MNLMILLFFSIVSLNLLAQNENSLDSGFIDIQNHMEESMQYTKNRDFDGDGKEDPIGFDYTGGAHCCYKMILVLSSTKDTIFYPFEMDGGYDFGIVDGSNLTHFAIGDFDEDGLEEIFMSIYTYNAQKYPVPKSVTRKYKVHSNYIVFDFKDGEMITEDYDSTKHKLEKMK
ncbi:MAG: VCBS repeat-containing protein [Crocinitomicaceae bacterium]